MCIYEQLASLGPGSENAPWPGCPSPVNGAREDGCGWLTWAEGGRRVGPRGPFSLELTLNCSLNATCRPPGREPGGDQALPRAVCSWAPILIPAEMEKQQHAHHSTAEKDNCIFKNSSLKKYTEQKQTHRRGTDRRLPGEKGWREGCTRSSGLVHANYCI